MLYFCVSTFRVGTYGACLSKHFPRYLRFLVSPHIASLKSLLLRCTSFYSRDSVLFGDVA
jgi:hypothetical protein